MKTWLAPLLLSMAPLAACVQITDFDSEEEGSDTGVEPTDSGDIQDSDTGVLCGNGAIDPGEACDDANEINGDGCQADCTVTGGETTWTVEDVDLAPGVAVVALPDGSFAVATQWGSQAAVLRFDATGQQVWAQTALFEDVSLGGLALSPDGDVIVLGSLVLEPDFAVAELWVGELWVGELSAGDGSEQWSALPGIPLGSTWGKAIAVDSEGALRIAGYSGGEGGSDVLMASLAADGTLEWWQDADELGGGYSEAIDVVVLPDGSAAFVGVAEFDAPDLWARRIDAAGQETWTIGFDDLVGQMGSIERRDDGTLMVVGLDDGPDGSYHTVVVELDEDGVEQQRTAWKRDGVTTQLLYGTTVASDGTLYVAGTVGDPDGGLYGALDQHGGHLWSQLFLADDLPYGIAHDAAVLADGSVVFVGTVGDGSGDGWRFWMRKTRA